MIEGSFSKSPETGDTSLAATNSGGHIPPFLSKPTTDLVLLLGNISDPVSGPVGTRLCSEDLAVRTVLPSDPKVEAVREKLLPPSCKRRVIEG